MLWVLLAAFSCTGGLQDKLDELWHVRGAHKINLTNSDLCFLFGSELVDGIGLPQASFLSHCFGRRMWLHWVSPRCVAWVDFVSTFLSHCFGEECGRIGLSQAVMTGWSSLRPSSFIASGPSFLFRRERSRTDSDVANTRSLSMFPARYDMFSLRQAGTKEGVQECVWCVNRANNCVNCVQYFCENESLVTVSATSCVWFAYFTWMFESRSILAKK